MVYKKHLEFTSKEEIINKPEIYALIQEDIKLFNKSFSKSERLLRFKLVPDEWSPNTGELSPTLKLRRRYISEKYKPLIDQIYGKQSDN
jgi:long-chain acyl-CoA synthetase